MTDETTQVEVPATDAIAPETEAPDSSPEDVSPVETGDDTAPEPEAKKPHWSQKRIDELTRNWREEQRRSEALLQMVQQRTEPPKAQEPVKVPTLAEFEYDEAKYQSAFIEYASKQAEAVVERRLTEVEQQRKEQTRVESFVTRQKEFAKATPDFEDKVLRDPSLPITSAMRDVIIDSPSGPELAYYLASNREAAESIASLPPHLAALEMGRIEGRLSALKEVKTRPVASKAPPPPPRVDDVGSIPSVKASDPASDKIYSDDEWMRQRTKEVKRKKV